MAPAPVDTRQWVFDARRCAPALLAQSDDPHAELLTLLWGPRFDREHALALWARLSQRQPHSAAPTLPVLLSAADRFDALRPQAQQRLRRMILRHRGQQVSAGLAM